jgi:hypothetical protein
MVVWLLAGIALAAIGLATLWLAAARPAWYAAGVACLLVILQPALVLFIFGRLRDTLVAGILSSLCLGYLLLRHRVARQGWLSWLLLAYLLMALPGTAVSLARGEIPYVWFIWAMTPALMYLLAIEATAATTLLRVRRVVGLLAVAQAVLALTMMMATQGVGWLTAVAAGASFDAEALRFNAWRFAEESSASTLDPRLLFINGTFEHSGALSLFLALALPTVLWLAARENGAGWRRLWRMTMVLLLTVIVFYFQRGAWLAAGVGMAIAAFADRPARRWLAAVSGVLLALFLFVPVFRTLIVERIGSSGTVVGRLENYSNALALWERHPVLGVGYGQYNRSVAEVGGTALNPHNDYLLHLSEEGVVGLLVYLGLYGVAAVNLLRLWRKLGPGPGRFGVTLGLATLATYAASVATAPGQTGLAIFLFLMALWEVEARADARELGRASVAGPGPRTAAT